METIMYAPESIYNSPESNKSYTLNSGITSSTATGNGSNTLWNAWNQNKESNYNEDPKNNFQTPVRKEVQKHATKGLCNLHFNNECHKIYLKGNIIKLE